MIGRGRFLAWSLLSFLLLAAAGDDPDREIARRHYLQGAALYSEGKYQAAIDEFEIARRVHASPALDFNIARCHDRLEQLAPAIENYERFLASHPADAVEAMQRLAILKQRRRPLVEPQGVLIETPKPPTTRTRYPVLVPAILTGIAGAALISGGVTYGVSGSRYDAFIKEGCGTTVSCSGARWGDTQTMERAGIALFIAGGVVAVVDVVLWAAWRKK